MIVITLMISRCDDGSLGLRSYGCERNGETLTLDDLLEVARLIVSAARIPAGEIETAVRLAVP